MVIFTKWNEVFSINVLDLWVKMDMLSKWGTILGLWNILITGTEVQRYKAINTFPEILEDFINNYKI